MLNRKLVRDFLRNKTQFISIFLMTVLGIALFVGFDFYRTGLETSINQYYDETNFADLWIDGDNLSKDELEIIKKIDGVKNAEGKICVNGKLVSDQEEIIYTSFIETNQISKLFLTEGEPFQAEGDGIWIDKIFAEAQELKPGDSISINSEIGKVTGTIAGLVLHPEYVYYQEFDTDMAPDYGEYGFAFLGMDNLPSVEESSTLYNQIIIDIAEGYDSENVKRRIEAQFPKENPVHIYGRDDMDSYMVFNSEIVQAETLGIVFPIVFLIVAFLGIATTMTRLTAAQRMQIGTLKALGFTKYAITRHYISFGFWICLVGSLIGAVIGRLLVPTVEFEYIRSEYILPCVFAKMSWKSAFIIIATTLISTFVAYMSCKNELADAPAVALTPKKPKIAKKSFIEKTEIWRHFQFGTRWNIRDIIRNPLRTVMGIIGIIGCCMLLVCAFGLNDTCMGIDKWMYDELYTSDGKVSFKSSLSDAECEEYAREYEGQLTQKTDTVFRKGELAKEGTLTVMDLGNLVHFQNSDLKEVKLPENGALVTQKMADVLGIDIGDSVDFKLVGNAKWYTVRVAGVYLDYCDMGIAMTKKNYEALQLDFSPNYMYTNYRLGDDFIKQEGISGYGTKQSMKEALIISMEGVTTNVTVLVVFALLLGSVMLYNLDSLSFSEKIREMATLKVLGFQTKVIRNILKIQNIWITMLGIFIGLFAGVKFLRVICASMSDSSDFPVILHAESLFLAALLTYLASGCVNMFMSAQVKNIDMVEALKGTE